MNCEYFLKRLSCKNCGWGQANFFSSVTKMRKIIWGYSRARTVMKERKDCKSRGGAGKLHEEICLQSFHREREIVGPV